MLLPCHESPAEPGTLQRGARLSLRAGLGAAGYGGCCGLTSPMQAPGSAGRTHAVSVGRDRCHLTVALLEGTTVPARHGTNGRVGQETAAV